MVDIPQRDLRNQISEVLRAAEAGAEYTVTVGGRPVAHLGPHRPRQWLSRQTVRDVLATPTDPAMLDDVRGHDATGDLEDDPWETG